MPKLEDLFVLPSEKGIGIWRYLDFAKFIAMLEAEGIYFPRTDKLGDPFEGSYSRANEELRPELYARYFTDAAGFVRLFSDLSDLTKWLRQWIYISCWHMNNTESAAMWKLYAKSNDAVAINSTLARLESELPDNVHLGTVNYIDYKTDWMPEGNFFYPFIHKRKSFEYENELRAIIFSGFSNEGHGYSLETSNPNAGISIPVDIINLIEGIYVAPDSASWFRELVENVCQRYALDNPVIQSSLDDEPFF